MTGGVVANIGLSIGLAGIIFSLYILYRNERVYKYLMKAIDEEYGKAVYYIRLTGTRVYDPRLRLDALDYGLMMRKFWVWPLSKFEPRQVSEEVK